MNKVRRVLELDPSTDARLRALAAERGQEASDVVADAISLLGSVVDVEGPDIDEDLRRLREFERTGEAVPLEDVKAWVDSWGTENELPPPKPKKVR
jgi:predicted transcriptional regulator